jgi:hypothetical protein
MKNALLRAMESFEYLSLIVIGDRILYAFAVSKKKHCSKDVK